MDTEFDEEEVVENPTLKAAYNLAPLHQNQPLPWDYEVHLIGEKIYDKFIHLCEICELPILVYGRMLPCKHIFCFDCARQCEKTCRRCKARVQKVEKSALGTVFVCTHGAPKHSTKGCRRTYLSQRDLQSHIAHRHMPKAAASEKPTQGQSVANPLQLPLTQQQAAQQSTQSVGPSSGGNSHSTAPSQVISMLPLSDSGSISTGSSGTSLLTIPAGGQAMPATSLQSFIPGLGDLRAISTMSAVNVRSSSPLIQAGVNSNSQDLVFSSSLSLPSAGSDQNIYRSLDMPSQHIHPQQFQQRLQDQQHQMHPQPLHSQLQRLHQSEGVSPMAGAHIQGSGGPMAIQSSLIPQQQQQISGGQGSTSAPSMENLMRAQQSQMHMVPQNLESTFKNQAGGGGQSRTNNLITVPIQDEGQYRPLPYVGPSQSNSSNPKFGPTQSFDLGSSIASNNFTNPAFSQIACSQNQTLVGVSNSQSFVTNSMARMQSPRPTVGLNPNIVQANQNPLPGNLSQGMLPGNQSARSGNQPMLAGNQSILHNKQALHQGNQSMMAGTQNLLPGNQSGQNIRPGLAGLVQNMGMGTIRGNPGQGLLPNQGAVAQGQPGTSNVTNRWGSPRQMFQPRMAQGQRLRGDNNFNPNYYN